MLTPADLDLDLVHGPRPCRSFSSASSAALERDIDVGRVVLAHAALEEAEDLNVSKPGSGLLAGLGEASLICVPGVPGRLVRLPLPRVDGRQRVADDRAVVGTCWSGPPVDA